MDYTAFAQNYKGPVLFTCLEAKIHTAFSGSEALQLRLKVEGVAELPRGKNVEKYDLDKYQDPTGVVLVDNIWLPMESDKGQFSPSGAPKYEGKATTVYKALVGWGFDGTFMPEMEEFEGLQAYGYIDKDKESGDPTCGYRNYRAV